jgi:hypothetical protein
MSSHMGTTYLRMQDSRDDIIHNVHPNVLVQFRLVNPVLGSVQIRSGLLNLG